MLFNGRLPPHPIISHLAQTKRGSHWFSLFSTLSRVTPVALSLCDVQSPCNCPAKPLHPSFFFHLSLSLLWKANIQMWIPVPAGIRGVLIALCNWTQSRMILTETWHFSVHRLTSWFTSVKMQTSQGQLNRPNNKSWAEARTADKSCMCGCWEYCKNQGH